MYKNCFYFGDNLLVYFGYINIVCLRQVYHGYEINFQFY